MAVGGVAGQAVEGEGPVVGGRDLAGGHLLAVGPEADRDGLGANPVAVAVVHPGLGAGDGGGLGVGVGDGEASCRGAGDGGLVALGDGVLGDGVGDGPAALVGGQVVEGAGPAVVGGELQGPAGVGAVGVEADGHGAGRGANPGLGDGHGGLLGLVPVGDREAGGCVAREGGLVALGHAQLADRVGDCLAIRGVLGQAIEGTAPLVGLAQGQGLALNHLAVCIELNLDGARADAVTVVVVLPGLGHLDGGGLGVGVGYGIASPHGACNRRVVVCDGFLGDGVLDRPAALVGGQALEAGRPVVCRAQD